MMAGRDCWCRLAAPVAMIGLASSSLAQVTELSAPGAQPLEWHLEGYPDWAGGWGRIGTIQWPGWEDAPLTDEAWSVFEEGQALQQTGSQGNDPTWNCIPGGMPRIMTAVLPMEIIVLPHVTYIYQEAYMQVRRVYTDGRGWPEYIEPSFNGYSIGEWEDTDADGRFDTLRIETRAIAGERTYGSNGLPLSPDDDTITIERIFLDPEDPNVLLNELTTIDGYLREPWTVTRRYARNRDPIWADYDCQSDNRHIRVNGEFYILSWDRSELLPTREGQGPPPFFEGNQ